MTVMEHQAHVMQSTCWDRLCSDAIVSGGGIVDRVSRIWVGDKQTTDMCTDAARPILDATANELPWLSIKVETFAM